MPRRSTIAGSALAELDRPGDALASYDAALALDPDYAECHWNRGLVRLRQGSLAPGWEDYEWRRRTDGWEPRDFPGTEWDGMPAPGRRVLLYAEQALGDTLQFARFARTVAAVGNDVVLEVQPALARLLQTLAGVTVVGRGAPLPAYDRHLPLMSVPHVLRLPSVTADGALSRGRTGANGALASRARGGWISGRDRLAGKSQGAGSQPRDPAAQPTRRYRKSRACGSSACTRTTVPRRSPACRME